MTTRTIIARDAAEGLRRPGSFRYIPVGVLLFLFFVVADIRMTKRTDYGLARVERLWRGNSFLFSTDSDLFDQQTLAGQLNVHVADLQTGQFVADAYINRLEATKRRPFRYLISLNWGDYTYFIGANMIMNAVVAAAFAMLLFYHDRARVVEEEVRNRDARHQRLSLELENKVRESERIIEKMNKLQSKLVDAEKLASIGRLAATLAHEIRNPLSIIKSSTEILVEDTPPGHHSAAPLAVVREEVVRLDRIISDLLNFARPKEARMERHNLKSLTRHWLPPVVEELEKDRIQLVPQFEDFDGDVYVDADQLYQVFLNLMWNARDALQGHSNPHVFVRAGEHDSQFASLEIRDTGIGMLPTVLTQVREPFFTTKTKGTGLGLTVSSQLIEGMGGRMEITSELEVGTTVRLLLPMASWWEQRHRNGRGPHDSAVGNDMLKASTAAPEDGA